MNQKQPSSSLSKGGEFTLFLCDVNRLCIQCMVCFKFLLKLQKISANIFSKRSSNVALIFCFSCQSQAMCVAAGDMVWTINQSEMSCLNFGSRK